MTVFLAGHSDGFEEPLVTPQEDLQDADALTNSLVVGEIHNGKHGALHDAGTDSMWHFETIA